MFVQQGKLMAIYIKNILLLWIFKILFDFILSLKNVFL